MSARIKGLLVVLALGALVSVWYLHGVVTLASNGSGLAADIGSTIAQRGTANADDDNDGLINAQETYWRTDPNNPDTDGDGYLDGEEILTGHNPLVKGPNDWLDPSKNLTQRTTDLVLGGMIAGALNPATASYKQSVGMLAGAMADQFKKNTVVTVDKVTVTGNDSASVQLYLKSMAPILVSVIVPAYKENGALLDSISDVSLADLSALTGDAARYAQFTQTTQRISVAMGARAAQIAAVPVPASMAATHTFATALALSKL